MNDDDRSYLNLIGVSYNHFMKGKKKQKDEIDWHWLKFRRDELWMIILAIGLLGGMFYYNIYVAKSKARDWERKEQAKSAYNTLEAGYVTEVGGFPPNSDNYEIRGCGDAICPLIENTGTVCHWGSDKPMVKLACGENDFMWLMTLPDNPNTEGRDAIRYKKLGELAVMEVCLERKDDPEASPLSMSKIGWTSEDCPSEMILIWPESQKK